MSLPSWFKVGDEVLVVKSGLCGSVIDVRVVAALNGRDVLTEWVRVDLPEAVWFKREHLYLVKPAFVKDYEPQLIDSNPESEFFGIQDDL